MKSNKEPVLLIDTREKKNQHILAFCETNGIAAEKKKLPVGDYSIRYGETGLENRVVVERKHGLDELCVNFGTDWARFERELCLAMRENIRLYLLIEHAGWGDIRTHNYRCRYPTDVLMDKLIQLQTRYNVRLIFCAQHFAPELIWRTLVSEAKEEQRAE